MNWLTVAKWLVWLAFIGDVVFLVGYTALPPRDWYKYPMGWHLVAWSFAFGLVTGTSSLRFLIGPLPVWFGVLELALVAGVIWWRTIWSLRLKLRRPRR